MIKKFGIKNFKRFKDSGLIAFSDITLLVGANNSGKSSFIKALILLNDNIANRDKSIYLDERAFDLHSNTCDNINLGSFKRVIYDKSDSRDITLCAEFQDIKGYNRYIEVVIGSNDIDEMSCIMQQITVRDHLNESETYRFDFHFDNSVTIHIPYKEFIETFNLDFRPGQTAIFRHADGTETESLKVCADYVQISKTDTKVDINEKGDGEIIIGDTSNKIKVANGYALVKVFGSTENRNDLISSLIAGINKDPYVNPDTIQLPDDEFFEAFQYILNSNTVDSYLQKYREIEQRVFLHVEYIQAHSIKKKVFFSIEDRNDYVARTLHEAYQTRALSEKYANIRDLSFFVNHWLQAFNIGKKVEIRCSEGDGYTAKIVAKDGYTKNLADIGTGAANLVLLLIKVATIIKTNKTGNVLLVLEEPEQNMHPNYQSLLADLLLAIQEEGIKVLVETHLEYLIRRSQILVARLSAENNYTQEELDEKNPFRVLYFPEDKQPFDMHYMVNGDFEHLFGEGFYDAAAKNRVELYRMQLGIE
jgi:predicted ATPase